MVNSPDGEPRRGSPPVAILPPMSAAVTCTKTRCSRATRCRPSNEVLGPSVTRPSPPLAHVESAPPTIKTSRAARGQVHDYRANTPGKPQKREHRRFVKNQSAILSISEKSFTLSRALIGAPDAASIAVWGLFTRAGKWPLSAHAR